MENETNLNDAVWAYGKDGWYMAKWIWDQKYANHLETLGYRVKRSVKKPVEA